MEPTELTLKNLQNVGKEFRRTNEMKPGPTGLFTAVMIFQEL